MSETTSYPACPVPARAERAGGAAWPAPSWIQPHDYVLVITVAVALTLWLLTGVPLLPVRPWMGTFLLIVTPRVFLGLAVFLLVRLVARVRRRGRLPAREFRALVSRHFGTERLVCAGRYLLSLAVVMTVQTSIKQAIPFIHRARYDGALMEVEKVVHLGFNPAWDLTASEVADWWAFLLDVCYYLWFPLLTFVAVYFLTHRNRRRRDHYLASFLGIWIVGVLLGLAVPSHGPCYVDAGRFPGADMPFCEVTQRWLGERYAETTSIDPAGDGGMTFGCGLMAMPSLHVTACVLYVIFLWREARWMRWASVAYAVLVFLGSVYSGWHYAIDGYVGVGIAALVVWWTGKLPYGGRLGRVLGAKG